jgi:hypothetical protein
MPPSAQHQANSRESVSLPQTLEQGVRLSQSRLWQWQRRYYDSQGALAWQQGSVPHYVTSNAFIAEAYAKVVLGYLRDCAATLDPGQPVYLVELGAGVGRFGFHFLGSLQERLARSPLAGLRVQYVLTDFADANVEYYRSHPRLLPLFAAGLLDCAQFDVESTPELSLRHRGVTLSPGGIANPVVFIANYVFDGVPQDAFYVKDGRLHESLVTLRAPGPIADADDPKLIEQVELRYTHEPLTLPYYQDEDWNRILLGYEQRERTGGFLFPCTALACLGRLQKLASDRMLLLSGDKGQHCLDDVCGPEPGLALHGSFSVMVNYHAIGEWVRARGGETLHSGHRQASLSLNAFRLGTNDATELRLAFADHVASGGPDDLFLIKKAVDYRYETLNPEQILALVRLSAFDAKIFWGCVPALRAHIEAGRLDAGLRTDLLAAVDYVLQKYFPIGDEMDLPAAIADLKSALDRPPAKPGPTRGLGHRFGSMRVLPPVPKTPR